MDYKIEQLKRTEEAIAMIERVFLKCEAPYLSEKGAKTFVNLIHNKELIENLIIYAVKVNEKIAGIIATKNEGSHITLFFVDEEFQGRGIGKSLFKKVLDNCEKSIITVNSSMYAIDIYKHLGFKETKEIQEVDGIKFLPMSYSK